MEAQKIEEGMEKQYLWKAMREGLKSNYDNSPWEVGVWREEEAPTEECVGLNASPRIIDAMSYVDMEILAKVEVAGKIIKGDDKWTCEKMRVVEAYVWPREESVRLAIFAAELVIGIYEKEYPNDDRPRKAIEAARNWLNSSRAAAGAAAWAAASAASEAASAAAAGEARAAARAAAGAAWAAAGEAGAAAWAAASAASEAASAAALNKIEKYLLSRIEHLEKYK